MSLGVSKRERAAPRAPEDEPLIDAEMFAELFDILDQMPGRVVIERSVWDASPCTALLEKNYAISFGIEKASIVRHYASAWTTMQKHNRLPFRIPALLVVKFVSRGNSQVTTIVRFYLVV